MAACILHFEDASKADEDEDEDDDEAVKSSQVRRCE